MEATWEKARDLGRQLGQSDEYKALQPGQGEGLERTRRWCTLLNRLGELEGEIAHASAAGTRAALGSGG